VRTWMAGAELCAGRPVGRRARCARWRGAGSHIVIPAKRSESGNDVAGRANLSPLSQGVRHCFPSLACDGTCIDPFYHGASDRRLEGRPKRRPETQEARCDRRRGKASNGPTRATAVRLKV
jgi:hypothetical protein